MKRWGGPLVGVARRRVLTSSVRPEGDKGREALAMGKEFLHSDQLTAAIREFKRAQLCFDESDPNEAISKADSLMELGEALILNSDRKMLASGVYQKRYAFAADTYRQSMDSFVKALSLYPVEEPFSVKRALCWQKAAWLQTHCELELKGSVQLLKEGLAEMPSRSPLWEGYFHTTNLILTAQVGEHSPTNFHLDRESLLEMSHMQMGLLTKHASEEQRAELGDAILNGMMIGASYWNVQLAAIYLPYSQAYCTSARQQYEVNMILAEAKYRAMEIATNGAWYYPPACNDEEAYPARFWNPLTVPEFLQGTPPITALADLGEKEALLALQYAELIKSDMAMYLSRHLLAKIYITRKTQREECRILLDRCVLIAKQADNSSMLGSAFTQLGNLSTRWDSPVEAEQWYRKAEGALTEEDCDATYELYEGMIGLFRARNDAESVGKYYQSMVALIKSQAEVTDRHWQILLGYATWQTSQGEYMEALTNIQEAFDYLKEIMLTRTFLKHDNVGPWHLMEALLSKIQSPDSSDRAIMSSFHETLGELKDYFPSTPPSTQVTFPIDSLRSIAFPKPFQINNRAISD